VAVDITALLAERRIAHLDRRVRGRPFTFAPVGLMIHHTASPRTSGALASLNVVRLGRAGLPGPLSQLLIGREGTIVATTDGYANHAGTGLSSVLRRVIDDQAPAGRARFVGSQVGNRHFIGIEIENDGVGEPYSAATLTAATRASGAICLGLGWNPLTRVIGHKEWTSRKIDPTFDMFDFRSRVADEIRQPRRTYRPGERILDPDDPAAIGIDVWLVQVRLTQAHEAMPDLVSSPGPADGIYGDRTARSVASWQAFLGIAADGLWGPQTQAATDAYDRR